MALYICLIRTDIPAGVLQALDLWPNESQKNLVYDPYGQTRYISNRVQNDTVATEASGLNTATSAAYNGLAAYLIDHVEKDADNDALTAANANTIALAIIANVLDAGVAATLANINAEIDAVATGSTLSGGNSTGDLEEVIRILAGEVYAVPAGSLVALNSVFNTAVSGSFDDPSRNRITEQTGAFELSRNHGHLSKMKSASFEYLGTTGAAIVIYGADGSLL